METLTLVVSAFVAVAFLGAGIAKVVGAAAMRADAERFGFDYRVYRVIGALEAAAAPGLGVGLFVDGMWWLGVAAAAGLVVTMVAAVIVHVRVRDTLQQSSSAIMFGALAAAAGVLQILTA